MKSMVKVFKKWKFLKQKKALNMNINPKGCNVCFQTNINLSHFFHFIEDVNISISSLQYIQNIGIIHLFWLSDSVIINFSFDFIVNVSLIKSYNVVNVSSSLNLWGLKCVFLSIIIPKVCLGCLILHNTLFHLNFSLIDYIVYY